MSLFKIESLSDVLDKVSLFITKLGKPYFGYNSELDNTKMAAVLLVLTITSFIRTLLNIDFESFFLTILLSFFTEFIIQILILNWFFAIGAVLDEIIKTKYLQIGWLLVLFYLLNV